MSGKFDYGGEPRLALGIACNPMSVAAFKRLWPAFISPEGPRLGGAAHRQRHRRASRHRDQRPARRRCSRRPADARRGPVGRDRRQRRASSARSTGLPAIRDADMTLRITGRTANDHARQGQRRRVARPAARRSPTACSRCRTRVRRRRRRACSFRVDGSVPAAAELLALDRLREFSGAPFDPATTRGTVDGAGPARHAAAARSAAGLDRLRHHRRSYEFQRRARCCIGQKVEAQTLRVTRQQPGLRDQGRRQDRRRAGPDRVSQAARARPTPRSGLQATLDEAARARFGLDVGPALAGPMPMKLTGRVGQDDRRRPLQRRGRSDQHARSKICCRAGSRRRRGRRAWPSPWSSRRPAACGSTIC